MLRVRWSFQIKSISWWKLQLILPNSAVLLIKTIDRIFENIFYISFFINVGYNRWIFIYFQSLLGAFNNYYFIYSATCKFSLLNIKIFCAPSAHSPDLKIWWNPIQRGQLCHFTVLPTRALPSLACNGWTLCG